MRPIDYVRQAFFARGRRELVVPEWSSDDHNFTVYFTSFTAAEEEAIRLREPKNSAEYNVYALILKAKDQDGTPLFTYGDKHALMTECDYLTLIRITNAMSQTLSEDDAKKKLRDDSFLHFRLSLAEVLHKTLDEIDALSIDELMLWGAYFHDKQQKAAQRG